MKVRTNLVLLLTGLVAVGGSLKIMCGLKKDVRYHQNFIPQRVIEINKDISELGNTRFSNIEVSGIEWKASSYKSLINERDAIYVSDPNIETAVEYVDNTPSIGGMAKFIPLFVAGGYAVMLGGYGLIEKGARRLIGC